MSTKYLQCGEGPVVQFQARDHRVRAAAIAGTFSIQASAIEAAGEVLFECENGFVTLPAHIGNEATHPIVVSGPSAESQLPSTMVAFLSTKRDLLQGTSLACILRSPTDFTAATVLTERLFASYAHGDHDGLQCGDVRQYVDVSGWPEGQAVFGTVKFVNQDEDYVLFATDKPLPAPVVGVPEMGMHYQLVGFSNRAGASPLSIQEGVIAGRDRDVVRGHVYGTSGSRAGDSGGPVIGWGGGLVAMNIGNVSADEGSLMSDGQGGYKSSGCSPRNVMVRCDRMLAAASLLKLHAL